MARRGFKLDIEAMKRAPGVMKALEEAAGGIVQDANNNTTAKVGVTWNYVDEQTIRVGPRGAAAIPVEYGAPSVSARRFAKRAIDSNRIR